MNARTRLGRLAFVTATIAVLAASLQFSSVSGAAAGPAGIAGHTRVVKPGPQRACGVQRRAPKQWAHVVWIVVENHGVDALTDAAKAPYLASLAARCGVATNMRAITHPSLPNYIAMTAGSTLGVEGSGPPAQHSLGARSIFSQVGPSGWRVYSQSMPTGCLDRDAGRYAVRHNPPPYFRRLAASCPSRDVPLRSRVNLSARFTMIIPDLDHGMHDSDVNTGDTFLSQLIPKLLASREYRQGNTAIFITADEDEGSAANRIATFVIAPTVRPGTRSDARFTHYSLLKTTEQMLGLHQLRNAANAGSMRRTFNLRRER